MSREREREWWSSGDARKYLIPIATVIYTVFRTYSSQSLVPFQLVLPNPSPRRYKQRLFKRQECISMYEAGVLHLGLHCHLMLSDIVLSSLATATAGSLGIMPFAMGTMLHEAGRHHRASCSMTINKFLGLIIFGRYGRPRDI